MQGSAISIIFVAVSLCTTLEKMKIESNSHFLQGIKSEMACQQSDWFFGGKINNSIVVGEMVFFQKLAWAWNYLWNEAETLLLLPFILTAFCTKKRGFEQEINFVLGLMVVWKSLYVTLSTMNFSYWKISLLLYTFLWGQFEV